ncbi:putative membrane protein YphA (DoxX/SURF4 family) [Streptomyces sp. CZ24]|uniref:DoxX family membrane protein n=2 Tax=Streptomyces TaxID=1883 RepID=UPI0004C91D06|nr:MULTISPECIES: DoxX family membrane protein [Streptomyces]MBL0778697.1 DoxX family membrane protein [Streptomyces albidoflavus]MBL0802470.1 DoxX family membrane protein [Streptomyces albidoflavus]MCQ9710135.1 DoxX family membrane protein [Streptomyces sp. BSP1]MCR0986004.1 DoxX family membrane protein [Streptomyces albidoflavus]MDH6191762.1 putative membrane protein YphA (DoxX/SURF4 family) [Streptomyces sp. CZ24]
MSGCGKVKAWQVPLRLVTGAFILHSGMEKWDGPDEQAQGVHGMARQTFPFLENIDAPRFLKLLAAGEIALGAALLTPMVPTRLAGAALTGFAGSLMAVYAQTPGLRKEGSVWPTPDGIGVSKDSWLLAIGLALTLSPHQKHHKHLKHLKGHGGRHQHHCHHEQGGRPGRHGHLQQAKQVAQEAKEARRLAKRVKGLSQDGHSHQHSHRHGPGHTRKGCPAHD